MDTSTPRDSIGGVEALAWWKLSLVPGLGPRWGQMLVEHFGSPARVWAATRAEWAEVARIPQALLVDMERHRDGDVLEQEMALCQQHGISIVTLADEAFPLSLREIPDPPLVLYLRGTLQPSDSLALAVVGTRHASPYGRRQTERLTRGLRQAGLTIVSGLARGIDAVAHAVALDGGGRTLAILAGGLLELYPREHRQLAERIIQQGALLSEMPVHWIPRRHAFPRRNRLISGLSLGVLVVEATSRSGALITARHALEQGRDVFAVPGDVEQRASRGCHRLLRDGAKLVESTDDILEELGPLAHPTPLPGGETILQVSELQLNPQEQRVLQAISTEPTRIEWVVRDSQLSIQRVLATLSVLETRRLISRWGGDAVMRRAFLPR